MIPVPSRVPVWLAVGHTDMRRGMNSLTVQVQQGLKAIRMPSDLYVFRGKRGHLVKMCQWAPKFPQKWAVKIPWFGGGILGSVISRGIDRWWPLKAADRVVLWPAADGGASWT